MPVTRKMLVPTLVDAVNLNAQVNNAREILSEWDVPGWQVNTLAYHQPDERLLHNPHIQVTRLWRKHAWYLHLFLCYLRSYDIIFYPGVTPTDAAGLRWRRRLGFDSKVIVTLEGLLGDAQRETEYSALAGHPVHCQHVPAATLARVDQRNQEANHIIAISPFLARMGKSRYGNKISVLPLGINSGVFYRSPRAANARLQIVAAGGVKDSKRPQLMLELARRFPECDFLWYGEGVMRSGLLREAAVRGLRNLYFPGQLPPAQLAEAFRAADVFVMPSLSEGVPKVSQEAAACGLAQVVFGFYETPTVIDGGNGFVVWNDEQFIASIGELIANRVLIEEFGRAGAEMSLAWSWQQVARQWREKLVELAT